MTCPRTHALFYPSSRKSWRGVSVTTPTMRSKADAHPARRDGFLPVNIAWVSFRTTSRALLSVSHYRGRRAGRMDRIHFRRPPLRHELRDDRRDLARRSTTTSRNHVNRDRCADRLPVVSGGWHQQSGRSFAQTVDATATSTNVSPIRPSGGARTVAGRRDLDDHECHQRLLQSQADYIAGTRRTMARNRSSPPARRGSISPPAQLSLQRRSTRDPTRRTSRPPVANARFPTPNTTLRRRGQQRCPPRNRALTIYRSLRWGITSSWYGGPALVPQRHANPL